MIERTILLMVFATGMAAVLCGQNVPPPPKPIIEREMENNSTKMRSIEMERLKREANSVRPRLEDPYRKSRFRETKKRFESIQRSQSEIVRAYTHSRRINYSMIRRSSLNIAKDAAWLDVVLFGSDPGDSKAVRSDKKESKAEVRDLIIDLDKAIGKFVTSKMFSNPKVVERKMSEEAQKRLKRIYDLSIKLSRAAGVGN